MNWAKRIVTTTFFLFKESIKFLWSQLIPHIVPKMLETTSIMSPRLTSKKSRVAREAETGGGESISGRRLIIFIFIRKSPKRRTRLFRSSSRYEKRRHMIIRSSCSRKDLIEWPGSIEIQIEIHHQRRLSLILILSRHRMLRRRRRCPRRRSEKVLWLWTEHVIHFFFRLRHWNGDDNDEFLSLYVFECMWREAKSYKDDEEDDDNG